jgi:hypothetical protein
VAALARRKEKPQRKRALRNRPCARVKDLTDRGSKIIHARAGHNDRVAAAMRFLGDPKKSAAIVLAELDVKTLPLDLELFCFDDAIHFQKTDESRADAHENGSKFLRHLLRKTLNLSGF